MISRILAKQYLANLQRNGELILREQGFYRQPLESSMYNEFITWLYDEIHAELRTGTQYQQKLKELSQE